MEKKSQLSSDIVGLMAKYWEPGRVKTRLGASIGMERSANLHQSFVHQLLCELGSHQELGIHETEQGGAGEHQDHRNWSFQWVASPPDSIDRCRRQIAKWDLGPIEIADQGDGDLGDRMWRWFSKFGQPFDRQQSADSSSAPRDASVAKAILIGSDCPLLSRSDIADAIGRLDHSDVVLGPAVDGGYYLVGFRCPANPDAQAIFKNMVWSREDVFDVTCKRLSEIKMTVSVLPTREDVDTQSELERLRESLLDHSLKSEDAVKRLRRKIDRIMEGSDET